MKSERTKLQENENYRGVFSGTFKRFGEKRGYNGYPETTVLLVNIQDRDGTIVGDHLWFNYTKGFKELGELKVGDIIQFDARVKKYYKGYQGYREDVPRSQKRDYKLSHPTKMSIIGINYDFLEELKKKQELEEQREKYEALNKKIYRYLISKFLVKNKSNVSCHLVYILSKKEICYTVVDYNGELESLSSDELDELLLRIKNKIRSVIVGFDIISFKTDWFFDKKRRKKLLFRLSLH
ncbi:MAG: hypothetical protein HZR80_00355 [Candidatus Heimdallarchaeota archaeon]